MSHKTSATTEEVPRRFSAIFARIQPGLVNRKRFSFKDVLPGYHDEDGEKVIPKDVQAMKSNAAIAAPH